jgi:hypothetical protein
MLLGCAMPSVSEIKHILEYGKDIVGFFGTISATIPFIKDWSVKQKITTAEKGRGITGDLTFDAYKAIADKYKHRSFVADKKTFSGYGQVFC